MYGNFQYEKIVWFFILSTGGGVVYHFYVFLDIFFVFMHLLHRAEVIMC